MLQDFRKLTRGWIARIFLLLLAVLMTVGLIQGNVVDQIMSGLGPQGVATVAGKPITPREITREFDAYLDNQRRQGQTITRQQAVEAGLPLRLRESIIQRRALEHYTNALGVSASDTMIAELLRGAPVFQNELTGAFDQDSYDRFVQERGYTSDEFVAEQRGELSVRMVLQSLTAGTRAPESYGKLTLAFTSETRTLTIAEAPAAIVGPIPEPTDAEVQAFYEEHADDLRIPEYRALTLVFARAEDFAARVDVPEQRLREEFESRRASLTQPERRTFAQISAPNEAQARTAAARLARGEAPDAVAAALGLQVVRYDQHARDQVTDSTIAGAVFAMPAGAAPQAVRGRLTPWAAIKLEAIAPATTPKFESLRAQLRDEIAADEASDLLAAAISSFEEARAAGTDATAAARANNLAIVNIPAMDKQGRTPEGQPVEALAGHDDLIQLAFETAEGEASDFLPLGNADVVVAVDRITPESTRPLAQVRADLVNALKGRETTRRLQALGAEVEAAVAGGQSFAAAARAHRLSIVVASRPIDRRAVGQIPARALGGEIFSAREGEVVSDLRADGGALLVVQVEKIERADPAQSAEIIEQARQQATQELASSFVDVVAATAVENARVRRNDTLMTRTFPSESAADDQTTQP